MEKVKEVKKKKKKPIRNPDAKSLEEFRAVSFHDRRAVRGGANNLVKKYMEDDYDE